MTASSPTDLPGPPSPFPAAGRKTAGKENSAHPVFGPKAVRYSVHGGSAAIRY